MMPRRGLRDGLKAADLYVKSDALVGIEAGSLLASTRSWRWQTDSGGDPPRKSWRIASRPSQRTRCVRHRARVLDPREAIRAIDAVVPKDWDIVVGGGHQAYFKRPDACRPRSATRRSVNSARSATACAMRSGCGCAPPGPRGKVVLFEGDGGLLFHIQELETLKRQGFAS